MPCGVTRVIVSHLKRVTAMADTEDTPPPPEPKTEQVRVAKPGVDDHKEVVSGAGGEKMSGLIADIADGDR